MACCLAPCGKNNVLDYLLCYEPTHVRSAVEGLTVLAQESKRCLVEQILQSEKKEDCIRVLIQLLYSSDYWLCSSAAYLFGVLMENGAIGRTLRECSHGANDSVVAVLGQLLKKNDPDTVTNSAGAIASLVETSEGRQWLLSQPEVFRQLLESLSHLLTHPRRSAVNAAALTLARLLLCEEACESLAAHPAATSTCSGLVRCLTHSDTDTAMNAAFAVGRLCGSEQGRTLILAQARQHQLVSSLQTLLCSGAGPEAGQTACFALSCLATEEDGHAAVLDCPSFPGLLDGLLQLLQRDDHDSTWFAAMAARVIVSRPEGVVTVREHGLLEKRLQALSLWPSLGQEVQEEVSGCLRRLRRLPMPAPVSLLRLPLGACHVSWEKCTPESGLDVTYCLQANDTVLYRGPLCDVTIPPTALLSAEVLPLRLSQSTSDGDVSPLSEPVVVEAEKAGLRGPGPPRELRVIGCTSTQVRLSWVEPEGEPRPKGYHIYRTGTLVDTTTDPGAIVSGLSPSTRYHLRVRAVGLSDAPGTFADVEASTTDTQAHAPTGLTVVVLGRHELHVSWGAPLSPLGRLFNYELRMNGAVAYLGTERFYTARRLAASTAYTCTVTAITSRGRSESRSLTKRTARDEYQNTHRCLYSPSRQTPPQPSTPSPPACEVKRKVKRSHLPHKHLPEVQHASYHHRRVVHNGDRDRHGHSPSVQLALGHESTHKPNQLPPGHESELDMRALLEGSRVDAEPQESLLTMPLGSPFPLRPKTELNLWGEPPLLDSTVITAKSSSGTLLQWNAPKRGSGKRGRLPLITSHTSGRARSIQPVSFSWCDLDWTGHHSDRMLQNRLAMGRRAHSESRGSKHHRTAEAITNMETHRT